MLYSTVYAQLESSTGFFLYFNFEFIRTCGNRVNGKAKLSRISQKKTEYQVRDGEKENEEKKNKRVLKHPFAQNEELFSSEFTAIQSIDQRSSPNQSIQRKCLCSTRTHLIVDFRMFLYICVGFIFE